MEVKRRNQSIIELSYKLTEKQLLIILLGFIISDSRYDVLDLLIESMKGMVEINEKCG